MCLSYNDYAKTNGVILCNTFLKNWDTDTVESTKKTHIAIEIEIEIEGEPLCNKENLYWLIQKTLSKGGNKAAQFSKRKLKTKYYNLI